MKDPTRGMSYEMSIDYWSKDEKPYEFEGAVRRFPTGLERMGAQDLTTDGQGNILAIKPVYGVPCFGLPIVWLRFANRRGYGQNENTGYPYPYRCGRCALAGACRIVVKERLKSDDNLRNLAVRWLWKHRHLQRYAFRNSEGSRLRQALKERGPFESANDRLVSLREEADMEKARTRDASRKRKERRKLLADGQLHEDYISALKFERYRRCKALLLYIRSAEAPVDMRKIPDRSSVRTVYVWSARQQLQWQRQPTGSAAIANFLIERGWNEGSSYDVLRANVPTHVERIRRYEREVLPGRTMPLWATFDPEGSLVSPR